MKHVEGRVQELIRPPDVSQIIPNNTEHNSVVLTLVNSNPPASYCTRPGRKAIFIAQRTLCLVPCICNQPTDTYSFARILTSVLRIRYASGYIPMA